MFFNSIHFSFPAVTICNWNAADENCPICGIDLYACYRVYPNGSIASCSNVVKYVNYTTDQGLFRCIQYNNDITNVQVSSTVGYGSSVTFLMYIPEVYVNASNGISIYGSGVQASFHNIGTIPPVFAETNFAAPNDNTYFMLTKTMENKLVGGQVQSKTYWTVRPSVINLPKLINQRGNTTFVGVSFCYETLNTFTLTDVVSYQVVNYLGDAAGMAGTLVGIDFVRFTKMVLRIPRALMTISLYPLWEMLVM